MVKSANEPSPYGINQYVNCPSTPVWHVDGEKEHPDPAHVAQGNTTLLHGADAG